MIPSKKAERMALWEELRNKQDPEPPQRPEVLGYDVPLSSDERSNNGTGPPMISRGISDEESGSRCSEDDEDLMFCGYGQGEPIAAIRPARLSETSELTDDDAGEEVAV
jgi:hypothetical protein